LTSLNSEWQHVVSRSTPLLVNWSRRFPVLAPCRDFDDLLAMVPSAPDAILGALVQLGADGEPIAWRVILQSMLGKAVLLSAGNDERFSEAVSELWVAIAEYSVERRPSAIAANLVWAMRRRLAALAAAPALAPSGDRPSEPEACAVSTLARARALGLLDDQDHRTLWLVYVAGLTSARAGAELGISPDLVRYRCSRSLRRLAGNADALAA